MASPVEPVSKKPMPFYFYHRTTQEKAIPIARTALKPLSSGPSVSGYISLSDTIEGTATRGTLPGEKPVSPMKDIIFRVRSDKLEEKKLEPIGKHTSEWRYFGEILRDNLEYQTYKQSASKTLSDRELWNRASILVPTAEASTQT